MFYLKVVVKCPCHFLHAFMENSLNFWGIHSFQSFDYRLWMYIRLNTLFLFYLGYFFDFYFVLGPLFCDLRYSGSWFLNLLKWNLSNSISNIIFLSFLVNLSFRHLIKLLFDDNHLILMLLLWNNLFFLQFRLKLI